MTTATVPGWSVYPRLRYGGIACIVVSMPQLHVVYPQNISRVAPAALRTSEFNRRWLDPLCASVVFVQRQPPPTVAVRDLGLVRGMGRSTDDHHIQVQPQRLV